MTFKNDGAKPSLQRLRMDRWQIAIKMPWGQCYKTFSVSNLRIFVIRVFVTSKPFQPILMFSGKAGAYLSEAPLRCSTLG